MSTHVLKLSPLSKLEIAVSSPKTASRPLQIVNMLIDKRPQTSPL